MQIIKPLGNKISEKVKNWSQIKKEAWKLKDFLDEKKFEGNWRDAYAFSHCQVSREPKNFFVVNQKMVKTFGSWCIINLKILEKADPCTFPEGCMSFMFRQVKRVDRFADIKVKYWIPVFNLFLMPKWKRFKAPLGADDKKGTVAVFICQHEFQHSLGKSIYFPD